MSVTHETGEETEGPGGARQLRSLDELEAKLAEAEVAWKVSDDAMREVFKSFVYLPPPDTPSDPYSAEYQEYQFALYRMIAERTHYEIENERCDFRVDANRPFPYYTESGRPWATS